MTAAPLLRAAPAAVATAARRVMAEHGLPRDILDVAACLELEPALAPVAPLLVGGDYTASDESGDAHRFTRRSRHAPPQRASISATTRRSNAWPLRVAGWPASSAVAPRAPIC